MAKPGLVLFFLALILCTLLPVNPVGADKGSTDHPVARIVKVIQIDGVINPVTTEFLDRSIREASDEKAAALIVMLDTPGGLDTSMRQMVKAILASPVPVVTYVSPSGARAASAGVFITLASPVAAMAPGTNIGAAHPVAMGGQKLEKDMSAKVENDAAAYIKSLAEKYGRNAEWAEQAVRKSVSVSESEALKLGIIDLVADNLDDLIAKLDGRKALTAYGEKILITRNASVVRLDMGRRLTFLKIITDPNVAYALLMLGILGVFFELSNPGLVLPGVVGGISIILAFYAFQALPVNYAGVLLILLGIIMFIAEIKITSYGLLSVGGIISLVLGSVMLIESPLPFMRISMKLILPVVITLSAFLIILMRVAIRARHAKVTTGSEALVGEAGEARTDIGPEGDVFVQGAHWLAYSDEPIKKGEKVVVQRVEGLRLKVSRKP